MGDAVVLLIACFMVIFNRFAADRAIEGQKKLTGIYPDDPIKAKRNGGLIFVAFGLFFIVSTLIQVYAQSATNSAALDITGPQRILAGFGFLFGARRLIVDRRIAVDLTTEQASEILKTEVPDKFANYVVVLFVGIFLVFGATMITTGFRQL
jgi:hypothetical protein